MNEELKRELDKVSAQGNAMARRFVLNKLVLMVVALSAIIGCLFWFSPIPCIFSQLMILAIVRMFSVKTHRAMQENLYVQCDPYLQYAFLERYSAMPFGKLKKVKDSGLVSKAQCMVLAGEPQMAISLLKEIKDINRLPVPTRAVYYNLMLRSYAQYGWEQKRMELVAKIEAEMSRLSDKMSIYLDVILRLEQLALAQESGNVAEVKEYYDENEGVYMFQKVSAHFALADVLLRAGKKDEAQSHIGFVREHGNKLYYIKELERQLALEENRQQEAMREKRQTALQKQAVGKASEDAGNNPAEQEREE